LAVLLIVLGVQPKTSSHSQFELRRRSGLGDEKAKILLRQREFLRDIISLQRAVASLCLVILSVISVYLFNWAAGLFLSIIIALEIGAVARIGLWQKYSQQLYEKYEPLILTAIERHQVILSLIRSVSPVVGGMIYISTQNRLNVSDINNDQLSVATSESPKASQLPSSSELARQDNHSICAHTPPRWQCH
jgi:hypothetical protein